MATLSQLSDAQRQALVGFGTGLGATQVDKYGQSFGGGKDITSYLAQLNQAFPDLHATLHDNTNSEGSYSGSNIDYDPNKLPAGWQQALTGPTGGIELSDPQSQWGTGPTRIIDQSKVNNSPDWGRTTGMSNIYQMPDKGRDVGFWGPLVMAAVTAGAGAGAIGGFGGMTDAAAQGLVSGATGSGLAPGTASLFGLSGSKLPNTFLGAGQQATSNNGSTAGALSSLMPLLGSGLGLPSYASTLSNLVLSQAMKPQGNGSGGK